MSETQPRSRGGIAVIIILAAIFFALLALIVLKSGDGNRDPALQKEETLSVVPIRIRIRTEPDARAPVVATATSGEQLTLLDDRGTWVRVRNSEGLAGWAERANLERTSEQQRRQVRDTAIRKLPPLEGTARTRAPLYAGPGIFYPLVGELSSGADVKVYTRSHDFYAVDQGTSIAWVDVDSVDLSVSGTHQLDVQTASAELPPDIGGDPTQTIPPEPPQELEPEPEPEPVPVVTPRYEERTGVYTAVPPGGTQPEEIDRVMPRYPAIARSRGVEGAVVVRGIVRRDGRMDDVEVIKDLPYGLGDAARRAVSRWRFRPATFQGEPIDVYYTVTVNFRLQ
jgi:TonB family protein